MTYRLISELSEMFREISRNGNVIVANVIYPRWSGSISYGISVLIHNSLSMTHYIAINYLYSFIALFVCDVCVLGVASMAPHEKLVQMMYETCIGVIGFVGKFSCFSLHYHLFGMLGKFFKSIVAPQELMS